MHDVAADIIGKEKYILGPCHGYSGWPSASFRSTTLHEQ